MEQIRLSRFLAQAGIAARRKAETLITGGSVEVNGEVITQLGTKVDPDRDKVRVDGQAVYAQDLFYAVLNKPKGCISAVSDPEGRLTVMDYLPRVPVAVKPVGRLDFNSEGVLLFTNDGELAAALTSSRRQVEKTYHVKVRGDVTESQLKKLRGGIVLDDGRRTKEAEVDRLRHKSKHDWLVITLTEGRNRQIHRMIDAIGHSVVKIQRVAFAGITFHGLRVGDARELSSAELKQLRTQVKLTANPRSSSRGTWSAKREDSDIGRRAKRKKLEEADAAAEAAGSPRRESAAAKRGAGPKAGSKPRGPADKTRGPAKGKRPASGKPAWTGKPAATSRGPAKGKRPASGKPAWTGKPAATSRGPAKGERPASGKPARTGKPAATSRGPAKGKRPASGKPARTGKPAATSRGPAKGKRPASGKPARTGKPASKRPSAKKAARNAANKSGTPARRGASRNQGGASRPSKRGPKKRG